MVVERAAKAEIMLTDARDGGYDFVQLFLLDWALHGVDTFRRRAPFEVLAIIDVGTGEELLIAEGQYVSW